MSHERHVVSNHWQLDCLFNRLFVRLLGPFERGCTGHPQRFSNAEMIPCCDVIKGFCWAFFWCGDIFTSWWLIRYIHIYSSGRDMGLIDRYLTTSNSSKTSDCVYTFGVYCSSLIITWVPFHYKDHLSIFLNYHYKDTTAVRPIYHYDENLYTVKAASLH